MIEREFYFGATADTLEKAKELRKTMTKAELLLWNELRRKQINGIRIRRQHPINRFIADFYCTKAKLVIEVDGEIHNYQKEYDIGRTHELENFGIKVIRFTNNDVYSNIANVVNIITNEIKLRC